MKMHPSLGLLAALIALPQSGWAQQIPPAPVSAPAAPAPTSPAAAPAAATSDAVRDALAKKAGDTDQTTLLKDTLSAVDKQYSLIKRGKVQLNYDLTYSYIGQEKINTDLSSGTATLFSIENNNSHTITNTLLVDYGLRNNITTSLTLPFISRYSDSPSFSGVSHTIGDIGGGVRWQPIEAQRDEPSLTVTGGVRIPSGTSPFKVDAGKGLATGSGVTAFNVGVNVNKIVDPVALFGSLNLSSSLHARKLNQVLSGSVLNEVRPGMGFGFGMGFAYALSYKITTSFSFQESISSGSTLLFASGTRGKTTTQTAGIVSIGAGYRVSPKTTVNVSVGIGMTAAAPNMSISLGLPLAL